MGTMKAGFWHPVTEKRYIITQDVQQQNTEMNHLKYGYLCDSVLQTYKFTMGFVNENQKLVDINQ